MTPPRQDNNGPSETSPLLGKNPAVTVEEGNGVASNGTVETSAPIEEDGGEIERQATNEARQKQFEGMPEVRKMMKYIMPALGIGVSSNS